MRTLNAITAADDLLEFLGTHPGERSRIHSVYPHALNLLVGESTLITITNRADLTPMGLELSPSESFAGLARAGEEIMLGTESLRSVNAAFEVNLEGASVWQSNLRADHPPRPIEEIASLRRRLAGWLASQPATGLMPLLPRLAKLPPRIGQASGNIYSRYIAEDLAAFTGAINASDWEHAQTLADRLVGFGMGSTPSCDDFLAAYLLVLKAAEMLHPGRFGWVSAFNRAIARKAENRSTLLSANMLRHASAGKTGRSHQRLLRTCLLNVKDDLADAASQVFGHGASSGGDFLLGLLCAMEWYQNAISETSKKGESAWVALQRPQPAPGI
jgi:hypothetical protein